MVQLGVIAAVLLLIPSLAQAILCDEGQNKVRFPNKTITCVDCITCPEGEEPYPPCSPIHVHEWRVHKQECRSCEENHFSDSRSTQSCGQCPTCRAHQEVLRNCSSKHPRVCGECEFGYYRESDGECYPCCCCNDKTIDISTGLKKEKCQKDYAGHRDQKVNTSYIQSINSI